VTLENPSPVEETRQIPLAYQAVRGGLWVALSSYWTIAFGFVANIGLTRLLSPADFGTFSLAMFFVQLLRLQTKLGLGYAFGQHKCVGGEAVTTYILLDIGAGISGLALFLLSAPLLRFLGYSSLVIRVGTALAAAAMMEGIGGVGGVLLEKELRFAPVSLVQSVAFPLSYAPAFWLATHDGGVWSLVAQNLTYNLLFLVGSAWFVWRRLPHIWQVQWRFSPLLARQFLRFGIVVGVGMLAGMLLTQLDNFFIGTFVGVSVLGFYDRAYRIAQWPSILFNAVLARTAFYTYARLQEDKERLQKTVTMVLWLITMLALPLALVLFITAPDLIVLLYGERWLPSALFLRILVVISVARPFWENAGSLFIGLGRPELTTRFTLIQALVLAITALPLTLIWNATGTCFAVGLAAIAGVALIYHNMQAEISLHPWSVLSGPALAAGLATLGYVAFSRLTGLNDLWLWIRVLVKVIYAATAFVGLIFLIQPSVTRERLQYIWRLALRRG